MHCGNRNKHSPTTVTRCLVTNNNTNFEILMLVGNDNDRNAGFVGGILTELRYKSEEDNWS